MTNQKPKYPVNYLVHLALIVSLLSYCLLSVDQSHAEGESHAQAGSSSSSRVSDSEQWQFEAGLYFWIPSLAATTTAGPDFTLDISDILDDLNMMAFATAGARKSNWSFMLDGIYLDLESEPAQRVSDVELQGVVLTPNVGYTIVDEDYARIELLGGVRYLYLDATVDVSSPDLPVAGRQLEDSGSNWDGIGGLRGEWYVPGNENFFIPFYGDVGTGESDLTWQLQAGLGFRFEKLDLYATYRYLRWNFDDNEALSDLEVYGPVIGVNYHF